MESFEKHDASPENRARNTCSENFNYRAIDWMKAGAK